jgi:DNA-directed RNA polymerase subunit RPC12/RpoP
MAPPKLSALKCPTCSAPLQVAPEQSDIRCQYCGNAIHIERQKAPTPGTVHVPANTVYLDPNAGKMVGRIILFSVLLPVAIPIVIALVSVGRSVTKSHVVSFPVVCGTNEEITISGKTFEGKGTLITGDNCKLTIKDSTLKGDVVVKASGGISDLKIINSKLEGATAAIELDGNTKVKISGKSEIKSPEVAINGKSNLNLTIEDSKVEGGEVAIKGTSSVDLVATKAQLLGKDAAIVLEGNGEITLKESTLKASEGAAITCGSNAKVTAEGSTVTGETAIKGESSLEMKLSKKSALKATGTAIETSSNCELEIEDSTVDSDDTAIHTTSNCKVKITKGGRVTGKSIGFDGTSNNDFVLQSGTLESGGTAIVGTSNIDIDAKKSTIKGGQNAFLLDSRPSKLAVVETQVLGAQVFDARESQKPKPAGTAEQKPAPVPTPVGTRAPAPVTPPKAAPFNGTAAMAALDVAAKSAAVSCKSSTPGKVARVLIDPGFLPNGSNANASVRAPFKNTPEGLCVEAVFKRVSIPPYDPATLNSGMMRLVELK